MSKRIPPEIEAQMIALYQSGQSKRQVGEAFGYGRGGVDKVLKRHGIQPRTQSEALKGRTLSDEWKAKVSANHADVSGTNNPMFGKSPGFRNGVFVAHLGREVRSTWEAFIAECLREMGVSHEYEAHRIRFNDATYMPDFYLPDFDVHVEVKGRFNDRSNAILPRVMSERPEIQLVIIDAKAYNAIRQDVGVLDAMIRDATMRLRPHHEVA